VYESTNLTMGGNMARVALRMMALSACLAISVRGSHGLWFWIEWRMVRFGCDCAGIVVWHEKSGSGSLSIQTAGVASEVVV